MFVRAPRADYGRFRAVCGVCPVCRECLEFALADDSLIGPWGGTNDAERRSLRRGAALSCRPARGPQGRDTAPKPPACCGPVRRRCASTTSPPPEP